MNTICYTSLRKKIIWSVVAVILTAAVVAVFLLMLQIKPPFYDENAQKGAPQNLAEEYGYTPYSATDVCDIVLCGNPKIDGKDVYFYVTNPENNTVLLRAEVYSVKFTYDNRGNITAANPGELLGRTGFLRPGEYTEKITMKKDMTKEPTNAMIKVATFEEDTEESHGFFYINTVIHPEIKKPS